MPDAAVLDVERPTFTCSAHLPNGAPCGATTRHATNPSMCSRGHWQAGNAGAKKHGLYSFQAHGAGALPPEVRTTIADFRAGVTADRGGASELTTIATSRIGHLAEVETTLRLLASDLARNGLTTKRGRVRTLFGQWLAALDRWERLAEKVGDGRAARRVPDLATYLREASARQADTAPAESEGM
jgi:hypothetical protein